MNFSLESLRETPIPVGDARFDFNVCGKTFSMPQSKILFLSPILTKYFASTGNPFEVSITETDKSNSIFKGITESSVIESFEIIDFLLNGFPPSASTLQNHFDSLLFLSVKLHFSDLLRSLNFLKESKFKLFDFEPSLCPSGDFDFDTAFTFKFGDALQSFKCSTFSAFLLSGKAQRLYNDENISERNIKIPSKFNDSEFLKHISDFLNIVNGKSIEITENSFEIYFEISKQLCNDQLLTAVFKFVCSHKFSTLSEKLEFASNFEIENDLENLSFENVFEEIAEKFESLNLASLTDLPPNSLFRLLKSLKFNIQRILFKIGIVLEFIIVI
jgi:hypothetical protein